MVKVHQFDVKSWGIFFYPENGLSLYCVQSSSGRRIFDVKLKFEENVFMHVPPLTA